jgi:DNA polymerase
MLGLDFLDQAEQDTIKPIIVQELGKYKQDKEKRYCLITHEWKQSFLYKKKMELLPVANSIAELKEIYKDCTLCHLGTKRKTRGSPVVFARGKDSKLDLFLIGEAPGTQEERDGIPFNPVAPAGGILDKVMKAVGIDQADCWISNSVICRPAPEEGEKGENGKPDAESIDYCNARLKNELAILQPKVVVLLGSVAYRAFYGKDIEQITKNVGWADQNGSIKTYVLLHPSYIARQLSFAQKDETKTAEIKQEYLNHWLEIKKAIT